MAAGVISSFESPEYGGLVPERSRGLVRARLMSELSEAPPNNNKCVSRITMSTLRDIDFERDASARSSELKVLWVGWTD